MIEPTFFKILHNVPYYGKIPRSRVCVQDGCDREGEPNQALQLHRQQGTLLQVWVLGGIYRVSCPSERSSSIRMTVSSLLGALVATKNLMVI